MASGGSITGTRGVLIVVLRHRRSAGGVIRGDSLTHRHSG